MSNCDGKTFSRRPNRARLGRGRQMSRDRARDSANRRWNIREAKRVVPLLSAPEGTPNISTSPTCWTRPARRCNATVSRVRC